MTDTKRNPDNFQLARQIYNARCRHFEKAAALLDGASLEVRALVEAHEEAEAQQSIELQPTAANTG